LIGRDIRWGDDCLVLGIRLILAASAVLMTQTARLDADLSELRFFIVQSFLDQST
jgi:hypothetical protein